MDAASRGRWRSGTSQPIELAAVGAAALAFYWATLAPTVVWGDSAMLSIDALTRSAHLGTAGDHPLFVLVASLLAALPGDVARHVNFTAALFGALTVVLVYRCGRLLGASRAAAATGAAALAVSHTFWLHSVIAEVYTANAFFFAAVLNLMVEWRQRRRCPWLAAAAAVFSVGLTNHLVLATLAPAAVAYVVATDGRGLLARPSLRRSAVVAIVLAAAVAALLAGRPSAVAAFWRLWWGPPGIWEYFDLGFAPRATAREALYYVGYLLYQFPSVSIGLGLLGAFVLIRARKTEALLLLLAVAVNAGMFVRHTVWPSRSVGGEKFVFYLTDYVAFAIFITVGADHVFNRLATSRVSAGRWLPLATLAAVLLVPPAFYSAMPSISRIARIDLVGARPLPYRDNDRFFLNPNKHGEDGARRFGLEALEAVKPGAVIFADFTPASVLAYLKAVERLRPDVLIQLSDGPSVHVRWLIDGTHVRPTYVATLVPSFYYDLAGLTGEYDLVPAGSIFEVRPRENP